MFLYNVSFVDLSTFFHTYILPHEYLSVSWAKERHHAPSFPLASQFPVKVTTTRTMKTPLLFFFIAFSLLNWSAWPCLIGIWQCCCSSISPALIGQWQFSISCNPSSSDCLCNFCHTYTVISVYLNVRDCKHMLYIWIRVLSTLYFRSVLIMTE